MSLMGKANSLGAPINPYLPGTTLFNGSNGDSGSIDLNKGCYYIRGQGAGAGGGSCGYFGTGGGGGSGAGFDGYIYASANITNLNCYSGIADTVTSKPGEATYIGELINLGGGGIGGSDNPVAGTGGILTVSDSLNIVSYRVKSNGNPGNKTTGDNGTQGGSDSVLTNDGAGIANGSFNERCASAPGAGGAGGKQWDAVGGYGGSGELLIKYIKPRP